MTTEFIKTYIDTALHKGTLNPSYIFEGADRKSMLELAMYTAAAILCKCDKIDSRPRGKCHTCRLVECGNHPDCIVVTHEKPAVIAVDEVRKQVVESIAIRPYYGGKKIYIIPDSELMNPNSQNALLKTIEEPPEYAHIIFLVGNKERLLQTIRSRCIVLSFSVEPEYHADDEGAALQFDRLGHYISGQDTYDTAEIMSFAKELATDYKDYLPELLTHIEIICRDMLFVRSGIDLTSVGDAGYIKKTAKISYEGIEKILKAVENARHDLLINVAAEAVLDSLLLHINQATRADI